MPVIATVVFYLWERTQLLIFALMESPRKVHEFGVTFIVLLKRSRPDRRLLYNYNSFFGLRVKHRISKLKYVSDSCVRAPFALPTAHLRCDAAGIVDVIQNFG